MSTNDRSSRNVTERTISILSFLTMFVIGTDTFVIAPLLPTLSKTFQVSTDHSGWMVSAYALGYALLAPIAGPMSDRRDRRQVLLFGLVAFMLTTTLCGVAQGFWSMILARFLAGVSAAFVSPQIWASIPIVVKPEYIVKTMGAATGGLAIAQVAGIPIGSFLAEYSWRLPFFAIGAASATLWLMLSRFFPSVPSIGHDRNAGLFETHGRLLQNKKLVIFMIAYLVFQTGNFGAISFYGSWFHMEFGLSLRDIGFSMMAIGVGNAIGSLFGVRLVSRIGLYPSLALSILTMAVLYAIIPMSPNAQTAVAMAALIMMVAGFSFPVFMGILQAQTESARGTVSALANAAMYIGTFIGGVVGGIMLSNVKGFYGIAAFTIVCYMISLTIYAKGGAFSRQK